MKYVAKSLENVATNTYDKVENWVVRAVEDAGNWTKQAGIDTKDWLNNDFLPWIYEDDPNRFDYENIIASSVAVFIGAFAVGAPFAATATPIPIVGQVAWSGVFAFAAGAALVTCIIEVYKELGEPYE